MDIVCVCDKHMDGRTYNNDITRYCNFFFDPLGWLLTGEWDPVIRFCPITLTSCCVYIVYHSVVSILFYRNDSTLECDLLATAQLLLMLG